MRVDGTENGQVRVAHNLAKTSVSFGLRSSILSIGCTQAVEKAIEVTSDGFLYGSVGPVAVAQLERTLNRHVAENLERLNGRLPHPLIPFRCYDLTLTAAEGLSYRYCATMPWIRTSARAGSARSCIPRRRDHQARSVPR